MFTEIQKELFWSNVKIGKNNECWEWSKAIFKTGYGQVTIARQKWYTHRLAFYLSKGKIEAGMVVMHTCDNKKCCNPNHLLQGTYKENTQDMLNKGRDALVGDKNYRRRVAYTMEEKQNLSNKLKGKIVLESTRKKMSNSFRKIPADIINEILEKSKTMTKASICRNYPISKTHLNRVLSKSTMYLLEENCG